MSAINGVFWSQIAIFAGAVIMAVGGLGAFHFSKKVEDEKDAESITQRSELNQKIEGLIEGNRQLQSGNDSLKKDLEPFKAYALGRFPDTDVTTALQKLQADLKRIDAITKPTAFKVVNPRQSAVDGKEVYEFDLTPVGSAVVPILSIAAGTNDGTKVESIAVTGPTIPPMSTVGSSDKGDAQKTEYRTVSPGPIHVKAVTEKKPAGIRFEISPLQEEVSTETKQ